MTISRIIHNVVVEDLARAARFYRALGLVTRFESDWYVQLGVPDTEIEFGLLARDGETVPAEIGGPAGCTVTFVVTDVDAVYDALRAAGVDVIEPPRNLFYGQRRMLLRDPDGTWLDISSECSPDPAWAARVSPRDGGGFVEAPE